MSRNSIFYVSQQNKQFIILLEKVNHRMFRRDLCSKDKSKLNPIDILMSP